MSTEGEHIHPVFERMLDRSAKEQLLGQRALVIWFYGLSGSGKSTLALALEKELHSRGKLTQVLDGDNIRTGLNRNLGFSDEDREENIRRIAEVAKLFLHAGLITIASFITPRQAYRDSAREIIGDADFLDVFVDCPYATCEARDVKGLYAKARAGQVQKFTGKDSGFERPTSPSLHLDTDTLSEDQALEQLLEAILPRIQ